MKKILPLILLVSAPAYGASFTEIYGIDSGDNTYVNGVSADGLVVVGDAYSFDENIHYGLRWTAAGGAEESNRLPDSARSEVFDVSDYDSVSVGTSWQANGTDYLATWQTYGSPPVMIGTLPGFTDSIASAVSFDGRVVAGWSYTNGLDITAFRWTAAEGMVSLGYLPGHGRSVAYDISGGGSMIVGYSQTASPSPLEIKAFKWTAGGGMEALPAPAGSFSRAFGVSKSGRYIVGEITVPDGSGGYTSNMVRWDDDGSYDELGPAGVVGAGGGRPSISADGSVIVGKSDQGAIIWSETYGVNLLADVLAGNGIYSTGDVSLDEAHGIADDNRTIVGWGGVGGPVQSTSRGWVIKLDTLQPRTLVDVDVLPGDAANEIEPGTTMPISVAILGKSIASGDNFDFDVNNIDPTSVDFGVGEVANTGTPVVQDVDGDSVPDLVLEFMARGSGILCSDTEVGLKGAAIGGGFAGADTITTTNCGWPHPDLVDNGLFTTDTVTGLDWLDLTETAEMTMVDALAANPGWRFPTQAETEELLWKLFPGYHDNSGGSCPNGTKCQFYSNDTFGTPTNDVTNFFDLFGITEWQGCGGWGVWSQGLYRDDSDIVRISGVWDRCDGGGYLGFIDGPDNTADYSDLYDTSTYGRIATYLVRPTVLTVDVVLDPFGWWNATNEVQADTDNPIPVAVYGKSMASGDAIDFDVNTINAAGIKFGTGAATYFGVPLIQDFDNDSNPDVMLTFGTQDSGILCGDTQVGLTGETSGGWAFTGTTNITTIDCDTGGCHP